MIVYIAAVALQLKPLREEFRNEFNKLLNKFHNLFTFSPCLLVYSEFTFLLLESILAIFQKILHFNNIFKFISRSMKSNFLKLTSSVFCFMPKIIISFIMFARKFVFYFTTLPLHPHTPHTHKKQNKPEIRVFGLGYKLYFFLKIL